MATKRTIILKGMDHCRYEEAKIGEAGCKPGHLVTLNSVGSIVKHTVRGGKCERMFLREDSLQGLTYLDTYTNGQNGGQYFICPPGTELQALLKAGENVAARDFLMSNGDGTLCKAVSGVLVENLADSTTVTNTVAETTFSNGTVTIPANNLRAGDIIRIRGTVAFPATNATDTATVRVKLGATTVLTIPATDVANGDVAQFDVSVYVRTVGAAGTIVASSTFSIGVLGTATLRTSTLDSTAIDTTVAQAITVTVQWSVANAGNQAILRTLVVEKIAGTATAGSTAGAGGGDIVGQAMVAKDLSVSGVDDFVEFRVL